MLSGGGAKCAGEEPVGEGHQQLWDGAVQPTCSFSAPPPPPPAPPLLGLEQTGNTRGGVRERFIPPFTIKRDELDEVMS